MDYCRSNFRATKKRPGFEPEPDFEPESSSWTLSYMVLFVAFLVMAASYFLQTNTPVSKQKRYLSVEVLYTISIGKSATVFTFVAGICSLVDIDPVAYLHVQI